VKARASIQINRSIEDVFAYVSDVSTMPMWVTGVKTARMVSPEMGKGAHFVLEYTGGWRPYELQVIVAEFDPPHVIALQTERGPFGFEGRIELEAVGDSTRVTNVIEAGPDSISTRMAVMLLGPLLKGSTNRRLLRELEALERSIEGDTQLQA
jgi:uncharacterized protein YndB with AHSA1/START domain